MKEDRKEYYKQWREKNKEHIKKYKKEYARTHDSSFKKMQQKCKQLETNWKELKKYLIDYSQILEYKPDSYEETMRDLLNEILEKMQEIEKWEKGE